MATERKIALCCIARGVGLRIPLFSCIQAERKIPFNQQLLERNRIAPNTVANHDDIFSASQDVSFFNQSNFGFVNFMFPHFRGKLYFQRRCVTKRNIPHPQSPTPQFRENLYFQPPQIWGMLCSKGFVNALNFELVRFFKVFNNERSFALVSNAGFIEPLSMHVYRILFFIEI